MTPAERASQREYAAAGAAYEALRDARPSVLYRIEFTNGAVVRITGRSRDEAIDRARAELPDRPSAGPVRSARKVPL